jgi:4-hydroxy-3-polyprenylbenzoate decarboxylase
MFRMTSVPPPRLLFGITGASGTAYAQVLLRELLRLDIQIHLIVSSSALLVMKEELGLTFENGKFSTSEYLGQDIPENRIIQYSDTDLAAGPASGSFRTVGMVICPCSMRTLATIATGTGASLITRAADACLKERRRLVLVPRETPLNLIHLRNMVTVTEAGAIVLPAMPGFYNRPSSIDDLLRHIALKTIDALGLDHGISLRWKDK